MQQESSYNRMNVFKKKKKACPLTPTEAIGRFCSEVFRSSMCEVECALRRTLKNRKAIIGQSGYIIDAEGTRIPVSGKSLEEALCVSPEAVAAELGGLPEDHMHCASLAVNTLGEAIDDYYRQAWGNREKSVQ
jgi:hypothetical protein